MFQDIKENRTEFNSPQLLQFLALIRVGGSNWISSTTKKHSAPHEAVGGLMDGPRGRLLVNFWKLNFLMNFSSKLVANEARWINLEVKIFFTSPYICGGPYEVRPKGPILVNFRTLAKQWGRILKIWNLSTLFPRL